MHVIMFTKEYQNLKLGVQCHGCTKITKLHRNALKPTGIYQHFLIIVSEQWVISNLGTSLNF